MMNDSTICVVSFLKHFIHLGGELLLVSKAPHERCDSAGAFRHRQIMLL